ncbi:hypothetical protein [Haloquadratum walsbyi]|uniref:hypothetical protein n=1 Tax=Haloquadratum walsbyi TaxID=293091 RepID=UPI0026EE2648|nr:hypothetical protein [Haloquadratum walsbyi]
MGQGLSSPSVPSSAESNQSPRSPNINTTLTQNEQCESEGDATVKFSSDGDKQSVTSVVIDGCAFGQNGCSIPILTQTSLNKESGSTQSVNNVTNTYADTDSVITVLITTTVNQNAAEMCTQALTPVGYSVHMNIEFDSCLDDNDYEHWTVRVIHEDINGRQVVAHMRIPRE